MRPSNKQAHATHDDERLDEGARPRLLRVVLHQRQPKGHRGRQQQDLQWGAGAGEEAGGRGCWAVGRVGAGGGLSGGDVRRSRREPWCTVLRPVTRTSQAAACTDISESSTRGGRRQAQAAAGAGGTRRRQPPPAGRALTSVSLNCSRISFHRGVAGAFCSSLKPYFSRRACTSSPVRPPARSVPCARSTSSTGRAQAARAGAILAPGRFQAPSDRLQQGGSPPAGPVGSRACGITGLCDHGPIAVLGTCGPGGGQALKLGDPSPRSPSCIQLTVGGEHPGACPRNAGAQGSARPHDGAMWGRQRAHRRPAPHRAQDTSQPCLTTTSCSPPVSGAASR